MKNNERCPRTLRWIVLLLGAGWLGCNAADLVEPYPSDEPTDSEGCDTGGACSTGPGIFVGQSRAVLVADLQAACESEDPAVTEACVDLTVGLRLVLDREGDLARGAVCSLDRDGETQRCAAVEAAADEWLMTLGPVDLDFNLGIGGDLATLHIESLTIDSGDAGLEVELEGEADFLFDDMILRAHIQGRGFDAGDVAPAAVHSGKTILLGQQPFALRFSEPVRCDSLPLEARPEGPSTAPLATADCDSLPGLPGYTLGLELAPVGAMWTEGTHHLVVDPVLDAAGNPSESLEYTVTVPALASNTNLGFELPEADSTWLLDRCERVTSYETLMPAEGLAMTACDNRGLLAGLLDVPSGATSLKLTLAANPDGRGEARAEVILHSAEGIGDALVVELASPGWHAVELPLPAGQNRVALFIENPDNGNCGECPFPWTVFIDNLRF